jgi:ABC-type molybdenum transport system ATPase subunit/photorepair protein PhrA
MASSTDSTTSGDLIRLEQITLRVGGRWILPDTSWTIAQGQNWVILGPNGSGKTSLTAALTGEVPVVAGRRWLNPDAIRAGHGSSFIRNPPAPDRPRRSPR